ncbi:MAG: ABC transporter ATP-binding protein [Paenibacillaceae bacterium]|nr:MAG: ABC transporter ATP-binding protein [Paenibacillaceae bacterium]
MITLNRVSKVFTTEAGSFKALKETDLQIKRGEFAAIMGPSGSGKSTLLQLIGGLDLPTAGGVTVDGAPLHQMSEQERTLFRRTRVGFVFQNYQLLPMMTVAENIALPLAANRASKGEIKDRVRQLLRDVNLEGKERSYPAQLSGGQQQRVAIARALAMKPKLILADEPTGNLDQRNGASVLSLLSRLNQEQQITIVMVTHDPQAARAANRIITIQDGEIVGDRQQGGDADDVADRLA